MHCSMREATQERCSRTSTKKNATRKRHFLWQAVAALLLCSNPLLRSDGGQAHAFHSLQLLRHRQRIPKRALSGAVASKYPLSNSNDSFQHHNRTDNNSNAAAAAANSKNYKSRRHGRRRNKQQATPQRREWLLQTTQTLLAAPAGSLTVGKWHELTSILTAWGAFGKTDSQAPVRMEALLKRLWQEHAAGNEQAVPTIELYTALLDAWACAALFQTHGRSASQRAREILVLLQETYEDTGTLQPTQQSFDIVLHMVCRTEGALIARRLLAWMEYLDKSGKNVAARPGRHEYLLVLETYCASGDENAGLLAEGFLRHMQCTPHQPDTFCYNLAIRAWQRAKRGRAAAEHADRILEEMTVPKDLVTYASVISAWACSGMKAHAVSRAEALLREIEDDPNLEKPNTVVLNAIMSAWVKSRNPAAVDRTAEILSNMRTDTATAKADLISYNTHLHALSMHGKGQGLAQRAQALLLEMEQGHDQGRLLFAPNLFSYNLVIDAWVRSSEANAAMRAADMLRQLVKRDGVDPDTFSFNQVLGALSKSSVPGALRMAQELLVYMEDAYQSGVHPNAQPDIMSYTNVIVAHSRGGEKGAAEQAEQLLDRVKARYKLNAEKCLKPDRFCYNSLIDCWARSGEGTLGARKAEALLQEMQSMYEAGDEYMAPNIITYNALLNAWARSGTRCCGVKAEYYLDRMWQLYKGGDTKVKPNDLSYNTVRYQEIFKTCARVSAFAQTVSSFHDVTGDQCHFQEPE